MFSFEWVVFSFSTGQRSKLSICIRHHGYPDEIVIAKQEIYDLNLSRRLVSTTTWVDLAKISFKSGLNGNLKWMDLGVLFDIILVAE